MAGRSERSEFLEKREDNLFAAMMKGFKYTEYGRAAAGVGDDVGGVAQQRTWK